jgi:hypothetical protein
MLNDFIFFFFFLLITQSPFFFGLATIIKRKYAKKDESKGTNGVSMSMGWKGGEMGV